MIEARALVVSARNSVNARALGKFFPYQAALARHLPARARHSTVFIFVTFHLVRNLNRMVYKTLPAGGPANVFFPLNQGRNSAQGSSSGRAVVRPMVRVARRFDRGGRERALENGGSCSRAVG